MVTLIKKLWNESRPEIIGGLAVIILTSISAVVWKYIVNAVKIIFKFLLLSLPVPIWNLILISIGPIFLYIGLKKIKNYFHKNSCTVAKKAIPIIANEEKNGLEWLKSLSKKEFKRYALLFWLPINNTLVFFLNFNALSYQDTPFFRDLLNHKILEFKGTTRAGHKYEINRQAYNFLEEEFISEFPEELKDVFKRPFDQVIHSQFFDDILSYYELYLSKKVNN